MINVLDFWQTEEFLYTRAIIITTGNCNLARILIWGLYFVPTAVVLMLKIIIPNFLCRVSKRPSFFQAKYTSERVYNQRLGHNNHGKH